MITLGKRGDLSARRKAAAFVRNEIADIHEEKRCSCCKISTSKTFQ